MDFEGWKSLCTRTSSLWGRCKGNLEHKHSFGYYGTPKTYKVVIVDNLTGDIKISEVINRDDYNSNITIDYQTMSIINNISDLPRGSSSFIEIVNPILIPMIITIALEAFILLCFELVSKKNMKTVLITNLISNLLFQIVLVTIDKIFGLYIIEIGCFIISEIIILITETLIYLRKFDSEERNKIIAYAVVANLVTALCTFYEWILFFIE